MASNSVNAFEGKLLEALSFLPRMDKNERMAAMRLFGQTAQFFHLQQEQVQQASPTPSRATPMLSIRPETNLTQSAPNEKDAALHSPVNHDHDEYQEHQGEEDFGQRTEGEGGPVNGIVRERSSSVFEDTGSGKLSSYLRHTARYAATFYHVFIDNLLSHICSALSPALDPLSSLALIENTEFQPFHDDDEDVSLMIARRNHLDLECGIPLLLTPSRLESSLTPTPLIWPMGASTRSPLVSPVGVSTGSPSISPSTTPAGSRACSPLVSPGIPYEQSRASSDAQRGPSLLPSSSGVLPERPVSIHVGGSGSWADERIDQLMHFSDDENEEHEGARLEDSMMVKTLPSVAAHFDVDEEDDEIHDVGDEGGDDGCRNDFNVKKTKMNDGANQVSNSDPDGADVGRNAIIFSNDVARATENESEDGEETVGVMDDEPTSEMGDVENGFDHNDGNDGDNDDENGTMDDDDCGVDNDAPVMTLSESSGLLVSAPTLSEVSLAQGSPSLNAEQREELAKNASIGKIGSLLKRSVSPVRVTRKLNLKWDKDGQLLSPHDDSSDEGKGDDDHRGGRDVFPPHNGETNGEDVEEPLPEYVDLSALNSTSLEKTSEKMSNEFVCPVCGKEIPSGKANFLAHLRRHDAAPKPFTCLRCGAGYQTKQNLQRHEKAKHLKLKPFRCDVCAKQYAREESLKVHQRTHQEEKSFICVSICEMGNGRP